MKKAIDIHALPEVGERAPWHKTETDWRSFLLSPSAPAWLIGWLQIVILGAATELALHFYYHPRGFALPPDATPQALLLGALARSMLDERPTFGPN